MSDTHVFVGALLIAVLAVGAAYFLGENQLTGFQIVPSIGDGELNSKSVSIKCEQLLTEKRLVDDKTYSNPLFLDFQKIGSKFIHEFEADCIKHTPNKIVQYDTCIPATYTFFNHGPPQSDSSNPVYTNKGSKTCYASARELCGTFGSVSQCELNNPSPSKLQCVPTLHQFVVELDNKLPDERATKEFILSCASLVSVDGAESGQVFSEPADVTQPANGLDTPSLILVISFLVLIGAFIFFTLIRKN